MVKSSWRLKYKRNNITRHVSKLKQAKLIIDDDGNIFLNPQIIAKGKFLQKGDENLIHLLEKGAEALEGTNVKPSILTPKMQKEKTKYDSSCEYSQLSKPTQSNTKKRAYARAVKKKSRRKRRFSWKDFCAAVRPLRHQIAWLGALPPAPRRRLLL